MYHLYRLAVVVLLSGSEIIAFTQQGLGLVSCSHGSRSNLLLSSSSNDDAAANERQNSRRSFINQAAINAVAMVGAWSLPTPSITTTTTNEGGIGMTTLTWRPPMAHAVTGNSKVNAKLKGYGLPVNPIPDGFVPVVDIYGKGKNRFPILVNFAYPLSWVLTLPSNDVNGEDGTIQAGEYAKGDTATLFVYTDPGHVDSITTQPKELFERALQKCIGQKGENMFQNFKVTKLEPAPYKFDKQEYMLVDFKYQLLTGAGFEVDRKGVASITSAGEAVEIFWAASTTIRYKKTEQQLRDIVNTFRCYTDGINFSNDLYEVEAI